ncbi:RidA family protein [Lactovum odontotermitis]
MKTVKTSQAPSAIGPYSQGKIAGNLLFASGQIPLDPATGEVAGSNITEQTEQVMKNIEALLASQNLTFDNVIKSTCYLADMNDFAAFNAVYEKSFAASYPARTAISVLGLPKDVLVEVEIIAELE